MTAETRASLTSIALCWRLERRDGAGIAMTGHDKVIVREGCVHEPNPGILPAAITKGEWDGPSGELFGSVTSDGLRNEDLAAGRWSGALSRLYAVDWHDPGSDSIELVTGEIGEIGIEGDVFRADLLGAAARLDVAVCPTTTPECRAALGDKQCRVDMAGRTMRAVVVGNSSNEVTLDQPLGERFSKGRLRWLSGANCGLKAGISSCSGSTLRLREMPRLPVKPGDRVQLVEGCDKRLQTCRDRFGNSANFRGEPQLPGNDLLTRYPGA